MLCCGEITEFHSSHELSSCCYHHYMHAYVQDYLRQSPHQHYNKYTHQVHEMHAFWLNLSPHFRIISDDWHVLLRFSLVLSWLNFELFAQGLYRQVTVRTSRLDDVMVGIMVWIDARALMNWWNELLLNSVESTINQVTLFSQNARTWFCLFVHRIPPPQIQHKSIDDATIEAEVENMRAFFTPLIASGVKLTSLILQGNSSMVENACIFVEYYVFLIVGSRAIRALVLVTLLFLFPLSPACLFNYISTHRLAWAKTVNGWSPSLDQWYSLL